MKLDLSEKFVALQQDLLSVEMTPWFHCTAARCLAEEKTFDLPRVVVEEHWAVWELPKAICQEAVLAEVAAAAAAAAAAEKAEIQMYPLVCQAVLTR